MVYKILLHVKSLLMEERNQQIIYVVKFYWY
jgi:hypothetical protein